MEIVTTVDGKCYCENNDYLVDVKKSSRSEHGKHSCFNDTANFFLLNSVSSKLVSNISTFNKKNTKN